ncbi:MAG TPA: TIGR04290 family methyltransferase [Kofleriaceae bacterium]|nr:TIGR04290 family methyltransferase [Kofleriaceae bacterium]
MTTRAPSYSRREIERRVTELGPWFHNLDLAGVKTAPDHFLGDYPSLKWQQFAGALPDDLTGRTVLDIGCNAGFYAIEMKRRGAARVVGMDSDPRYLAQARFAADVLGVDLELHRMSVYDVAALGERFDLVLFMGVLYHLRYPMLALDVVADSALGGLLVFQSMLRGDRVVAEVADDYPFEETGVFSAPGYPLMYFVEKRYAGDPTNWWIPNRAGVEAMLRAAGLRILASPEDEVFFCVRDEELSHGRSRDDLERAQQRVALGLRDRP